jgi:hypothetical protein
MMTFFTQNISSSAVTAFTSDVYYPVASAEYLTVWHFTAK